VMEASAEMPGLFSLYKIHETDALKHCNIHLMFWRRSTAARLSPV